MRTPPTQSSHSGGASNAAAGAGIRTLLIDSSAERRRLIGHIAEQDPGISVVGAAEDLAGAEALIVSLDAAAVIVEIQLPVRDALVLISALRLRFPDLTIIVCSFRADTVTRLDAIASGADDYLAKPVSPRDLHRTLRTSVRARAAEKR